MQLVRASFALLIAYTTILEVSSHEIIQQLQVRTTLYTCKVIL